MINVGRQIRHFCQIFAPLQATWLQNSCFSKAVATGSILQATIHTEQYLLLATPEQTFSTGSW